MSPENLNKLKKLRKKLDILDNSFIKLIKKRTKIVEKVLSLKENKNEIVDKKRIKIILNQIKKKINQKKYRSKNYKQNMEKYDIRIH